MLETTKVAELRVFAPAKLNWVLTIAGRRPDGYHDLHTIFQALAFGDELRCRPLSRRVCRIRCSVPGIPTGDDNLIARAWKTLSSALPERVGGLEVDLIKRIPAGAGLGGGSSNAAAALLALNRLYGLGLTRAELMEFASRVGSDCPFFFVGGTAIGTGRGEGLVPLTNRLSGVALVVLWPGFASSTAEAYRRAGPEHYADDKRMQVVAKAIEQGNGEMLQKNVFNVFSGLVCAGDLRYIQIHKWLKSEGLSAPLLCGSGSAVAALARNAKHARLAGQHLRKTYPWTYATRLRNSGVGILRPAGLEDSSTFTRIASNSRRNGPDG